MNANKPAVQRAMNLARHFRAAHSQDYDQAYKELETFIYALAQPQAETAAASEPVLFVSPGQLEAHDPQKTGKANYLPCVRRQEGLFTMPLYAVAPAAPDAALVAMRAAKMRVDAARILACSAWSDVMEGGNISSAKCDVAQAAEKKLCDAINQLAALASQPPTPPAAPATAEEVPAPIARDDADLHLARTGERISARAPWPFPDRSRV